MLIEDAGSGFAGAAARAAASDASPLEKEVTALFDVWRAPLLGYVVTLGLPAAEGEELVQEAFLALFQHLRDGKPRDNLRGWLFRVAHNQGLKRRSALGRESLCVDVVDTLRCPAPDPERALAIKQRESRLLSVMSALPEQDRCCLHLRAEGLRYREIADVLGISLGGVALSLGRSLERLRRADR